MKNIDDIARSWLGVKFKLQGRTKESGCDCIGLILGIAREIEFVSQTGKSAAEIDCINYNLKSDPLKIKQALDEEFYPAPLNKAKIILLEYGKYMHLGFHTDDNQLIHAHITARAVVSNFFDDFYKQRVVATYSYWKV